MRITKTQLKRLIKEEYSSMNEGGLETPQNVGQLLDQIEAKMGTYMGTIDDIREMMTFILGIIDKVVEHPQNETDFTQSEEITSLRNLSRVLLKKSQLVAKGTAGTPEGASAADSDL
jgi:hypothetical protein